MTKLNIKKDTSEKVEKTAAIGSFLEIEGSLYVLAQCDFLVVVAISLATGNRYEDPKRVKNLLHITEQEIEQIVGGDDYNYVDTVNIHYN